MENNARKPSGEDLMANVVELGGLIEYQQGAVVSRTIINKPTGTVTLFAFDQREELSEHTSPFDALVYVLEGQAEVTVCGRPFPVTGGQMLLMPAHEPHAVKATGRFKMLLVMIRS